MKNEIDFKLEYEAHKDEILSTIASVLHSGRYINGHKVAEFEREFASRTGTKYCVAVGNGYDALYLSYKALGIDRGSVVGIYRQLHISTTNAALACGAKVKHFTRFLLPCNLLVYVHDPRYPSPGGTMIYHRNGVEVIEDCCQVVGSKCHYGCGVIQCWSFHPLKKLHCYGDGGAITTNDKNIADKIRQMRDHGRVGKTDMYGWGCNSRLDEIQAAILLVMMEYVM
jgi:dTDP-4-amino-4,6-dideoxygalactose transaminase